MGAWGHLPFDNDTAGDWIVELDDTNDLTLVERALKGVEVVGFEYLEVDAASEALAGCEVLARLRGKPGFQNESTETVDAWVKANAQAPSPELLKRASKVIDRILGDSSELRELWEEGDLGATWRKGVEDLKSRLA